MVKSITGLKQDYGGRTLKEILVLNARVDRKKKYRKGDHFVGFCFGQCPWYSGLILRGIWGVRDGTQVSCMQDKNLTHCAISLTREIIFNQTPLQTKSMETLSLLQGVIKCH